MSGLNEEADGRPTASQSSSNFDNFSPFPRYSAFAAVLAQRQSENEATKEAENAVQKLKRKHLENASTAADNSAAAAAFPKKAKIARLEVLNNNSVVMRLPPSAKSGLCQQRARESSLFLGSSSHAELKQKRFK